MSHKPDSITAKDSGGSFSPHPEGQFAMSCVDVVNLGVNVEQYADQEPREVAKIALVFASGERQEDESLTYVTTEMTLSANEKANLRKFVEAWRGKSYTVEQAAEGIPIHKLHSQSALISIEHITTRKGRKFAKISSISPLPKAMPGPHPGLVEQYARPKFLTDRAAQYAEALRKHRAMNGDALPTAAELAADDDDPLPF